MNVDKILEEYKHANSVERDIMWIRFIGLRGQFADIEAGTKYIMKGLRMEPETMPVAS